MNHCIKLICAACLSSMIFFSCSTHKDKNCSFKNSQSSMIVEDCSSIDSQSYKESSFPVFENLSLSAVQLSANDRPNNLLLVVDTAEREKERGRERESSFKNSQSSTDCSFVSLLSCSKCSPVGSLSCTDYSSEHTEEYFNLPSPTVDTKEYKTVCEGDNPPLRGGNQSVDNPPLRGGNQSSQIDNPPIQQFSITDEEIEMLKYIVEQETRGGSYRHKCIVTNVVLNRVKDSRFPNTVRGVLLQKNQFSSTWNYYQKRNKPDKNTVNAVNDVLNGKVKDESNGALYFHSMSSDGWFSSLSFVMEMEGHRFFK